LSGQQHSLSPALLDTSRFRFWMCASVVLLYGTLVFLTFDTIEEDAYIYFRFAANMANGHGYVFNIGGPPVEAGSSLVWQLLLVPLYFIDPAMVISTKLMGILCAGLALRLMYLVSRQFTSDPLLVWVPLFWLVVSAPFYMWSHLGLETPLTLVLCLWLLLCLLRADLSHYWPLAATLVICNRPEGFMFCLLLIPAYFYQRASIFKPRSGMLFLGLVFAVELFRLVYFKDLLPHSFYNKIFVSDRSLITTLQGFLTKSLLLLPLALMLLMAAMGWWRTRQISYRGCLLLLAIIVTMIWGAVGDDMKFFDRAFASFIAMLSLGFVAAFEYAGLTRKRLRTTAILTAVIFILPLLFLSRSTLGGNSVVFALEGATRYARQTELSLGQRITHWFTPDTHLPREQRNILIEPVDFLYDNHQVMPGEFIAANYPDDITVVYDQMGQTPWYAGPDVHFIDSLGLVDRPIGHYVFNEKMADSALLTVFSGITRPIFRLFGDEDRAQWDEAAMMSYLFDQRPELIMLHGLIVGSGADVVPVKINNDPRLRENYTLRYGINFTLVYERNDILTDNQSVVFPVNCTCSRLAEAADGSYINLDTDSTLGPDDFQ